MFDNLIETFRRMNGISTPFGEEAWDNHREAIKWEVCEILAIDDMGFVAKVIGLNGPDGITTASIRLRSMLSVKDQVSRLRLHLELAAAERDRQQANLAFLISQSKVIRRRISLHRLESDIITNEVNILKELIHHPVSLIADGSAQLKIMRRIDEVEQQSATLNQQISDSEAQMNIIQSETNNVRKQMANLGEQLQDLDAESESLSQQIKNADNPDFSIDKMLVDGLRAELQKDDWEPITEMGENWYSYSFRRRIK